MRSSIFVFLMLMLVSCNDFLNRPPLNQIGEDSYWLTSLDLGKYIIQFYEKLPGHGFWGNGYGYPVLNSDNVISYVPNIVLSGTRGTTVGRWVNDWVNIRGVNIFFDNYEKCNDDFDQYKHFLGEAHFFRAWFYYDLVRKYGDVPWYNTELQPILNNELLRGRDSRTIVIDSILFNIDKAIQFLNSKNEVGNNRINKETALAFKTRIALYEGTWQKYHAGTVFGTPNTDPSRYFRASVEAAKELINGQYEVGLHPDYYELFGMDDMSGVNEILFYKAYNSSDDLGNDVQYATTSLPIGMGVTWELVTSYLSVDGEPYDYLNASLNYKGNEFLSKIAEDVDPRLHATIWIPGDEMVSQPFISFVRPGINQLDNLLNPTGFQLKKCSNPNSIGAGKSGGGIGETGYIYFRYGEVLLNYAEALYELEGLIAQDQLDQLRSRVGMPRFGVNNQMSDLNRVSYGYTISDALYEIRRERRIELALEGLREDDYRRWAAHGIFKGQRPKGYPFKKTEFPDFEPLVDENGLIDFFKVLLPNGYQFDENRDYLDCIPIEELSLNENIIQNPGW